MRLIQVPSVLLATLTSSVLAKDTITAFPSTGSGPGDGSSCLAAVKSWNEGSSAWAKKYQVLSTTIEPIGGGKQVKTYTVYENATTLCDGHPRVTYSPAKSIGLTTKTSGGSITGKTTIVNTYVSPAWDKPYPTCIIPPADCDQLWSTYHSQVEAAATITPAPVTTIATPPCANQTAASQNAAFTSSLYGCGKCTIYGEGVELVYFPTSTSRDLCATTPTNTVTHYGKGAVITAYSGTNYTGPDPAKGAQIAIVDGHTFTSGTAYISIRKVFAVDRCTKTFGNVVSNAILAMPSESVLSLRYKQDHFQFLQETATVTGYPVQYADFNNPIPYSAWVGQNHCEFGLEDFTCGIIYENNFRPQLAIPPEITQLSPDFAGCQMWYNGLWDPPLALTQRSEAAKPTLPHASKYPTPEPAAPSSRVGTHMVTATATALPNEVSESTGHGAVKPASTGGGGGGGYGGLGNDTPNNENDDDDDTHPNTSSSSSSNDNNNSDNNNNNNNNNNSSPPNTNDTNEDTTTPTSENPTESPTPIIEQSPSTTSTGGATGFSATMQNSFLLGIFVFVLIVA